MSAIEQLRRELGAEPPAGLTRALDERELELLAERIRAARASQSRAVARALNDALGHLPRLLRVPVQRILR